MLGSIVLISGWWFVRNQILYGDPLAYQLMLTSAIFPRAGPLTPPELFQISLPWLWQTFWGGPTPGDFAPALLLALGALTAHVNKLGAKRDGAGGDRRATEQDEKARRTIPLILAVYDKVDREPRRSFEAALCRAAGRPEPPPNLSNEPAEIARRLQEWKEWWAKQQQ